MANVVFGIEALAVLPDKLTRAQRALVTKMKSELKSYILNLGLSYADVARLFRLFQGGGSGPKRRNR